MKGPIIVGLVIIALVTLARPALTDLYNDDFNIYSIDELPTTSDDAFVGVEQKEPEKVEDSYDGNGEKKKTKKGSAVVPRRLSVVKIGTMIAPLSKPLRYICGVGGLMFISSRVAMFAWHKYKDFQASSASNGKLQSSLSEKGLSLDTLKADQVNQSIKKIFRKVGLNYCKYFLENRKRYGWHFCKCITNKMSMQLIY